MAAVAAVTGVLVLVGGWYRRSVFDQLSGIDVTDVSQIPETGPVELDGTVTGVDDPISAPFTDRDAAVVAWSIEELHEVGSGVHWEEIGNGVETTPFRLDDGSGTVAVDIGDHVNTSAGGGSVARTGVYVNGMHMLAVFDTFPVEQEVGTDDLPEVVRDFEQRIDTTNLGRGAGASREKRRYLEQVIQSGDDAFVLGTAVAPADGARSLSPDDVTITARESGLSVVSNQDGASVEAKFDRNSELWLAGGVVLIAIGVVVAAITLL